jgi:hypothetical protein
MQCIALSLENGGVCRPHAATAATLCPIQCCIMALWDVSTDLRLLVALK